MGKNTDKLYVTHSEWQSGGHSASNKGTVSVRVDRTVSALPFWTCSISQQPIGEDCGVVDKDGHVYDIKNVMPYIRKHARNPVTSEPMESHKELIKLKLSKNPDGKYVDPVSLKEFQPLSKAVLIRPSGRVYLEETVQENNVKSKFWRDLVSDEEFKRSDIIPLIGGAGVKQNQKEPNRDKSVEKKATVQYAKPSLTSTAVDAPTGKTAKEKEIELERRLKPKRFTTTGYCTIDTDLGQLGIELYPKYSPKAVYNFVKLAQDGYFDGIAFHRNIKNFMIQTGDPTGTGTGGKSIFGKPFADETNTPMKHERRGTLAMANKGKNTNTSQFFITYRRCPHLDGKHTVFGQVVEGLSVLDKLERVPVGRDDKPTQPISMYQVKILIDPFEQEETEEPQEKSDQIEDDSPWLRKESGGVSTIGKYLNKPSTDRTNDNDDSEDDQPKKRRKTTLSYSSFNAW